MSWILAMGGLCQGSAMITAQVTVQIVAGTRQLGAAAASVQLARSLGSAFGVAIAGAVLFIVLSSTFDCGNAILRDDPLRTFSACRTARRAADGSAGRYRDRFPRRFPHGCVLLLHHRCNGVDDAGAANMRGASAA